MLDCCNGYTVTVHVGVVNAEGSLIASTNGMPPNQAEDIIHDVLEGVCPVCNGKMTSKINAL